MINLHVIPNDYTNWSKIPNYPCRFLVIRVSRSGKRNYLRNYHQRTFINYKYVQILPLDQVSDVN